jgi:hypothetical protein
MQIGVALHHVRCLPKIFLSLSLLLVFSTCRRTSTTNSFSSAPHLNVKAFQSRLARARCYDAIGIVSVLSPESGQRIVSESRWDRFSGGRFSSRPADLQTALTQATHCSLDDVSWRTLHLPPFSCILLFPCRWMMTTSNHVFFSQLNRP